jgi:hypothetical protein
MPNHDNLNLQHGGFKGTCSSCPFNAGMTEEAEVAQN